MRQFLVDSGALLALIDADDQHHAAAAVFARSNATATFHVPETVFIETMVLTKARLGVKAAVDLGSRIIASSHAPVARRRSGSKR